ncbi:hypothetical protein AC579_3237 [Pseudocercospora musae]|uniref:Uncharacterized protein n=1 Tax=Pseudocercospora musae TaxID=113226 RepID=A0A139GT50_9PEZI|nr:hypothetical protein AC579_3237 [Pseudocercospora musae]
MASDMLTIQETDTDSIYNRIARIHPADEQSSEPVFVTYDGFNRGHRVKARNLEPLTYEEIQELVNAMKRFLKDLGKNTEVTEIQISITDTGKSLIYQAHTLITGLVRVQIVPVDRLGNEQVNTTSSFRKSGDAAAFDNAVGAAVEKIINGLEKEVAESWLNQVDRTVEYAGNRAVIFAHDDASAHRSYLSTTTSYGVLVSTEMV